MNPLPSLKSARRLSAWAGAVALASGVTVTAIAANVIDATALATMVSNDLIFPTLLRGAGAKKDGVAPGYAFAAHSDEENLRVCEALFGFAYVWTMGGSIASDALEPPVAGSCACLLEHDAQNTSPHARQWCLRFSSEKRALQLPPCRWWQKPMRTPLILAPTMTANSLSLWFCLQHFQTFWSTVVQVLLLAWRPIWRRIT